MLAVLLPLALLSACIHPAGCFSPELVISHRGQPLHSLARWGCSSALHPTHPLPHPHFCDDGCSSFLPKSLPINITDPCDAEQSPPGPAGRLLFCLLVRCHQDPCTLGEAWLLLGEEGAQGGGKACGGRRGVAFRLSAQAVESVAGCKEMWVVRESTPPTFS